MSLFNSIRQGIVKKLIRPEEDGYLPVGDKDIKFYYNEQNDIYLLGMYTDNGYYNKPTLMGWRDGWVHSDPIKEIPFDKWIYGVLDNIGEQYSKRLDALTVQDIKILTKSKKGKKLMINKESFCAIMQSLDKYWRDLHKIEEVFNVIFENNTLTAVFDSIVDALVDDLEPDLETYEDPVIYEWLFRYDGGRAKEANEGIDGHPLTTASELYDYLVWKRDVRENETETDMCEECDLWGE